MNWIKSIKNNQQSQTIWHFCLFFINRILKEQIHITAGYLSYVTLMSLVPLIVVMLSVMTAFPIFTDIKEIIENFVYQNFMPAAGDVVKEHITGFVTNASEMSAIAISFLFLFALLLISAIDTSLNKIWRVTTKRRIVTAFSMYWMVLTLGPVLMGSSIAATSYIVSLISIGNYDVFGLTNIALRALPIFASIGAFLILYMVVPNKVVPLKHALFGATLAALLFEVAKKGFAFYITQLPSYEAIYGALAGIPILFLWVYLSWLVVLFGALFTVSLENFKPEDHQREHLDKHQIS
ncbi:MULTISPECIES: virulence factor BrkB family protein [unclassified Colwellia]|uniref:virulence factor BrkB family protein n=1 Tax=unclassified Colwellia TaxID=196834 RepID=UPI0015F4BCD0|nr:MULTISPECIES: virulence factor BrkB family protein [unclassified Colwellia]MBA6362340.1 virulence factor BrkB family protein [Colwellia sp. BRX8-8]MBA6346818.1 virulence factor BrkB family protein [Colwellia sp. BRX8-9]MBA6350454.1 virulence factor BrkB family protein [Colwellia sp. BRX9-1]MBA6355445.1 virulence factor BrkB family protein [Colwellia sp. BRX8-3]MBA6358791.1 virulence factor BrkB family protein [Colwellia sp. BRX8-6]|tara:strand:- start:4338 stop:5219 length:882 start_codon:yes stop_codon:yes gene_type:complete